MPMHAANMLFVRPRADVQRVIEEQVVRLCWKLWQNLLPRSLVNMEGLDRPLPGMQV